MAHNKRVFRRMTNATYYEIGEDLKGSRRFHIAGLVRLLKRPDMEVQFLDEKTGLDITKAILNRAGSRAALKGPYELPGLVANYLHKHGESLPPNLPSERADWRRWRKATTQARDKKSTTKAELLAAIVELRERVATLERRAMSPSQADELMRENRERVDRALLDWQAELTEVFGPPGVKKI